MSIQRKAWLELTEGILFSYSQIFFIKHRLTALIILISTFFVPALGFWGLSGVVLTHILALLLGFDRKYLQDGLLGLNSILAAMALASYFEAGLPFFIILLSVCILTLLLAISTINWLGSRGLPFLSIPFLLSSWTILLALRGFSAVDPNPGNIFFLNDLFAIGGLSLVEWYEKMNAIPIPEFILGYFKSLSAIVFQYNWLAGLSIAVALLLGSRISFLLSLLGYVAGYLFYILVGASINALFYSYIGFNFILLAIALGGFFFIPSWKSFLMVCILMPVLALLVSGTSAVLSPLQLPVFSLPFVILVLIMIYASYFTSKPHLVKTLIQQFIPEKNLYAYLTYKKRFGRSVPIGIGLPFLGEWTLVQGYDGKHTHKGPWKHALDFVVMGSNGLTYKSDGLICEDYFCYNLPILAPADGRVVEVIDHVPDNQPGEVNLQENWGNIVILEHAYGLFSKLSHLKHGTIIVSKGEYVRRGDILANLGNSGRSPEPHLHFQLQATPDMGSPTLAYPLAWYLKNNKGNLELHSFEIPETGDQLLSISPSPMLMEGMNFKPGKMLSFEFLGHNQPTRRDDLIVQVDAANKTYLECLRTHAIAYFEISGPFIYFTAYYGKKSSLLYHIYLSMYKVLLSTQPGIVLKDTIPLDHYLPVKKRFWQDLLSPFYLYRSIQYTHRILKPNDVFEPEFIEMESNIISLRGKRRITNHTYLIKIDRQGIYEITLGTSQQQFHIKRSTTANSYPVEASW